MATEIYSWLGLVSAASGREPSCRRRGMASQSDADLTFEEVKQLVEAASPAIILQIDTPNEASGKESKGRYLVAARDLQPGEVILREYPLFQGFWDGSQSRRACVESFAKLAEDDAENFPEALEDSLHPCSPIVDCLSGIILCRLEALQADAEAERARSRLKLRKLLALSQSGSLGILPDSFPEDLLERLVPDLRRLTSSAELRKMALALLCNRFANEAEAPLDVNFAGSMFEHSCAPNCFVSNRNWFRVSAGDGQKCYRTQKAVAKGEALSIDYLMLPDSYLPLRERSEMLRQWGFQCTCERCIHKVDFSRAFVCPACGAPELCALQPGVEKTAHAYTAIAGSQKQEEPPSALFECQACKAQPAADYIAKCIAYETTLRSIASGKPEAGGPIPASSAEEPRLLAGGEGDVVGCFHYFAFQAMWRVVTNGPKAAGSIESYEEATHGLIECIQRLYGNAAHPQLLDLYHTMAQIYQDDVSEQRYWLDLEHQVLKTNYPEEALRQDDEVMALIQGRGPWTHGPAHFTGPSLFAMD